MATLLFRGNKEAYKSEVSMFFMRNRMKTKKNLYLDLEAIFF